MSTKESKPLEVIDYYYDNNPTDEDLMGASDYQLKAIRRLLDVLDRYHEGTGWCDSGELNLYYTSDFTEYPNAPDVLSFRSGVVPLEQQGRLRSWRIAPPHQMPPSVVFEFSSHSTWRKDVEIEHKPTVYGIMGISEYFAYDPNEPQVWADTSTRLRGWRYVDAQPQELIPDAQGWLWSEELQSWLVPNTRYLQLYDSELRLRFTEAQAERQDKQIAQAGQRSERVAKEAAQTREQKERAAKEVAQAELAKLLERLRQQGIDLN